jgi:hypothetical protein
MNRQEMARNDQIQEVADNWLNVSNEMVRWSKLIGRIF